MSRPLTRLNLMVQEGEEVKRLFARSMRLDADIVQAHTEHRDDTDELIKEREQVEKELLLWLKAVLIGHISYSEMGAINERE